MKKVIVSLLVSSFAAACASADDSHVATVVASDGPSAGGVHADQVEIVRGVSDRGRDPAVVAIDIGSTALCTGTLIAPRVVLTARHCVAQTSEEIDCPSNAAQVGAQRSASVFHIILGDDAFAGAPVARGVSVLTPKTQVLCDSDIALIVLDRPVTGIVPLPVRRDGVAKGDHVRAVGFGKAGDDADAGMKLLRDHVLVLDTTAHEFVVGEATCQGDSGGPAIDEATGEIVGVVSRGGPACDGTNVHNIYTRTDGFLPLIDEAMRQAVGPGDDEPGDGDLDAGVHKIADAGKSKDAGAKAQKPATDMGGACTTGADCSTGVCVSEHDKQYCSRTCGPHDRCPTHYGCTAATSGTMVCVAK